MPAGALITLDWQVELRGTLTGPGTDFTIEMPGIAGFGQRAKRNDTPLGHAHGTYLGRHYRDEQILTIPYAIDAATPDDAGGLFVFLNDLWDPSETDEELHMQLPGFGHVSFLGRPLGLLDDISLLHAGVVRALASFVCGDATMTVESGS